MYVVHVFQHFRALEKLLAEGATLPKRINFNNPPDYALELLEVYYRIHASILKLEFGKPLSIGVLTELTDVLNRVDNAGVFPGRGGGGGEKSNKVDSANSQSSEADSCSEAPATATAPPGGGGEGGKDQQPPAQAESQWDKVAEKCVNALQEVVKRYVTITPLPRF